MHLHMLVTSSTDKPPWKSNLLLFLQYAYLTQQLLCYTALRSDLMKTATKASAQWSLLYSQSNVLEGTSKAAIHLTFIPKSQGEIWQSARLSLYFTALPAIMHLQCCVLTCHPASQRFRCFYSGGSGPSSVPHANASLESRASSQVPGLNYCSEQELNIWGGLHSNARCTKSQVRMQPGLSLLDIAEIISEVTNTTVFLSICCCHRAESISTRTKPF